MQRFIRLSFFTILLGMLSVSIGFAQKPIVQVSGSISPGDVRVFLKDSAYVINNDYVVGGTLIIEPGTTIYFNANSRLIDSTGGRIIADGFAKATYTANPGGLNPVVTYEPLGYASFDYFFYNAVNQFNDNSAVARTIRIETPKDPTVNNNKYNHIFHVVLDKSTRKVVNLVDPNDFPINRNSTHSMNPNHVVVSFEQALMFYAARLNNDPENFDPNLKTLPWRRVGGQNVNNVNIVPEKINFVGSPAGNFSREWGHIIVLPGARAAFFRNVNFENIRKDTTVDRQPIYNALVQGPQFNAINKRLNQLTNGAGGAITTFSSRTWLIDVTFKGNMARNRGGALNILQAPQEYAFLSGGNTVQTLGFYAPNKNPNLTNKDGSPSTVNYNTVIRIDNIDEVVPEPLNDTYRQAFDDGRTAVFLGRMRRLTFQDNYVQLASVKTETINGEKRTYDVVDQPADFPYTTGNHAFGGAIYIAGVIEYKDRVIEVGFGVNNSINIGGQEVQFPQPDIFIAKNNKSKNYQQAKGSEGARGGAIYVGKYTSLIVAGEFTGNGTEAKYFADPNDFGEDAYNYSQGGAIFMENTLGRLQVRGGPSRENLNPTYFTQNYSGAGGAIFNDGNTSDWESPVIGGSDAFIFTRDYGFDIKFENNSALTFGGAILSKRHMSINGAGGVEAEAILGYDGKYPVRFWNNEAGFAGGAIDIRIPNAIPPLPAFKRAVKIVRAEFLNNTVGNEIDGNNLSQIRGGGAIYSYNGDLRVVKGTDFIGNTVYHGNGGAIAIVNLQDANAKKYFVSDLDEIWYDSEGLPYNYISVNGPFTGENQKYPADVRMLTRFLDNKIFNPNTEFFESQLGSGTTQVGQGTPMTNLRILSTYWINDNTGFAVGYDGLLIKFTNGGNTWQYLNSGTTYRLTDVVFTTPSVGYIAGDRGIIRKTIDGGNTWTTLNTGLDKQINDIFFVGSNLGYAVTNDGYILKTTNAGDTWTSQKVSSLNLNSVYMTSSTNGYVVGDNAEVLFTTNGNDWQYRQISGTTQNLNSIIFLNTQKGFIFGNNGVGLVTNNGGNTWDFINTGTTQSFQKAYFTTQNNGYVVATGGIAYRTTNGGTTWENMNTGSSLGYYGLHFPSLSRGYIVGDIGTILKSTNGGDTWEKVYPANMALQDVNRKNKDANLPENGLGLGGAIYILDSVTVNKVGRIDSINFNRVRIQDNEAFSGSAIYSDNYNLKLIFNRSLITGNVATSSIGIEQNVIVGPVDKDNGGKIVANVASSDLVGATIYGEIQGPLPSYKFSEAANSIYNNKARFLIRLPDAPNTKGILAGTTGIGFGGTDTLRGNFWGHTEANVKFVLPHVQDNPLYAIMETFFVAGDGNNWLPLVYPELISNNPTDPRNKGPFESLERGDVTYKPIVLKNVAGDQNTPDPGSIPEKLVFSGHIYDIYDKTTDIKTADYSKRRMSPIEDFAVGIPPRLRTFTDPSQPSYNKVIKRWTRDPFVAEARDDQGNLKYPGIAAVQTEFKADENGVYYHPIGYPLYLETRANYEDLTRRSNHDPRLLNHSIFFVINLKTGDFVRANLQQVDENAPYREVFRQTIELVPDSTNRTDPTWRRTSEGLANLGSGPELLANLMLNPYNEDASALQGRRYTADDNALARVENLFSNRPGMPQSNLIGNISNTTFYAGERYRALPVRVGDSVLIVSRTILWREGIQQAALKGMAFRITESTRPPVWTGNIISLQKDTIKQRLPKEDDPSNKEEVVYTEFLNKIFLTEDRPYPVQFRKYSGLDILGDPAGEIAGGRGRDSIIRITAIDSNRFYDPRSFIEPNGYARLTYDWSIHQNSPLSRWLVVNRKYVSDGQAWGAQGYLELGGLPINPFVVPGGDSITVFAHNFPPTYRNVDNLKAMNPPVSQDEIDKWIETFPPYLSNQSYVINNARFLQQDTINVGPNYTSSYTFKIFVVDSMPRFLDPGEDEVIYRLDNQNEIYVQYYGTVYKCGTDRNNRLIANLTDKLRFQIDINTDDEWEDKSPAAQGWDFRYGRTAYGFQNIAIRYNPADTSVVDTLMYDGDPLGLPPGAILVQSRPSWMANQYLYKYDSDTDEDNFGVDFTLHGQLNVRIPRDTAWNMIYRKVSEVVNNQEFFHDRYNTDTNFVVVVNDGHGGINSRRYDVVVNIQPTITTDSLPIAIEDNDYNPSLLDDTRMIKVFDPNFGQKHTFKLIYVDSPENEIPIDNCYPEAGKIDLTNMKTTPKWLKINPNTGLLYGTPRVKDAPKNELITVVVTDENGLSTYKQIPLEVRGVAHDPIVTGIPEVECIDPNKPYSTEVTIIDTDLNRTNPRDTLTLFLVDENNQPISGLTISPSIIVSTGNSDRATARINKTGTLSPNASGWVIVRVVAQDRYGKQAYLEFRLTVSEPTDFTATLRVQNVKGAYQDLEFGTSSVQGTSTGDGNDGDYVGKLDNSLCEIELPPRPFDDAFDARWTIPNRNGVLRNIFPTGRNVNNTFYYLGRFQAGGVMGGTSPLYPVTITWDPKEIPAINDRVKNPNGSSWWIRDRFSNGTIFSINMRNINERLLNSQVAFKEENGKAVLTILDDGIDQFVIMHDWISSVEDLGIAGQYTRITSVSPNPVNGNAKIEFEINKSTRTTIQIVDMIGNIISTIVDEELNNGTYSIDWDATDAAGSKLASGQYMIRLIAGSAISTYPVVVVK